MSNIENQSRPTPGMKSYADLEKITNVEDEHRKGITVVRAHIENGEITIVGDIDKAFSEVSLNVTNDQASINESDENLVGSQSSDDEVAEKATLGFLYIGSDQSHYDHLSRQFNFGYQKRSLDEGVKYSLQLYMENKRLPDILFIDVPLNLDSLNNFCFKLKGNILLSNLPVVYSEDQLGHDHPDLLARVQGIDDIMKLDSQEIDYFSTTMFLRQCRLYSQSMHVARAVLRKSKNWRRPFSLHLKRFTDILLAGLAILLLSPVLLIIGILIRLDSKGPIFYTSLRAGRGFKVFRFYKFRSMVPGAEKVVDKMSHLNQYGAVDGPLFFKVSKDPRITRFGKFIRNTSVDELPQLFNVLKGDMSIVGNRPLPLYEAVSLTTDEFVERFSAPAGITGLWQVNKRGKQEMSTEERINLDITYSRRHSFLYDLRIMVRTPVALLQKSDV